MRHTLTLLAFLVVLPPVSGQGLIKLLPRDGTGGEYFGNSVAISGGTAIVGALRDDDNGTLSGSAYLFDTTTGNQIAKLLPDDGAADDEFGRSVAISGGTAIVGAWGDDDNGINSGSAYLFDTTTGNQIAKLTPNDGAAEDGFGAFVAISGGTAIVGAPLDDDNGRTSGSAYLYLPDCNDNGVFDSTDISDGTSQDCNFNGVPDECDTGSGASTDCNANSIPDECEPDGDNDGIPDDCEKLNDLDCSEFNRYETLTPNDTLTVISGHHNPDAEQGYLRVVAVNEDLDPVSFDHLIGNVTVINGFESIDYGINAVDYRAAVDPGLPTDVDGDGIRDLNGIEYEKTAGRIMVPRFIGQSDSYESELLLIGLSGGRKFDTKVDFIVANDNEVLSSTEHTFRCWDKVTLKSISHVFSHAHLASSTDHDEQEDLGGNETGWFWMDGGVANSTAASIIDPAFYAVYIERLYHFSAADLPFEACTQSGHLLPNTILGDNEEIAGEAPQDCGVNIPRRQPGSLLLYPEFDNISGMHTVITVTNTSPVESIKAHFIYVGRYGI